MQPNSAASLVSKALSGAMALGVRQVVVQGANIAGGVLLARLLSPREFGFFAIVTFLLAFLNTFGGTGLAANLIRQSSSPTRRDIASVFTFQQLLVLLIATGLWLVAPFMTKVYGLEGDGAWVFRLLAPALVATSFMVVPQVLLERELAFGKLALVEGLQAIVFNATAVAGAAAGAGSLSFSLALLVRALLGASMASIVHPWRVRWLWDWSTAKKHLAFGVPFQGTSAISLVKDSITPVFVGLFLGVSKVGFINWATMVSGYAVMALMIFARMYMPVFARLQDQPRHLALFVEDVVSATNAITAPIAVFMLVMIRPITHFVFGDKWLVAVPLFYLLWFGNLVVPTATPLVGMLNALGRSRTTFAFAALWMVTTWVLGLPLIWRLGMIGFGCATIGVQLTNLLLFREAQRAVPFRLWRPIGRYWIAALSLAAPLAGLTRITSIDALWLVGLTGIAYLSFYAGALALRYPVTTKRVLSVLKGDT